MTIMLILISLVFLVLAIYDTLQSYHHGPRWAKPLLMVLVSLFFILYRVNAGQTFQADSICVIAALLCGAAGDHLLEQGEKYFAVGLSAFLIGHGLYIIAIVPQIVLHSLTWRTIAAAIAAAVVYIVVVILLVRPLMPHIDQSMRLPVWIYMIVLVAMSYLSLLRWMTAGGFTFMTWIGSLFFVASDTILAYKIFAGRKDKLIMETYLCAQVFIMFGFLLA